MVAIVQPYVFAEHLLLAHHAAVLGTTGSYLYCEKKKLGFRQQSSICDAAPPRRRRRNQAIQILFRCMPPSHSSPAKPLPPSRWRFRGGPVINKPRRLQMPKKLRRGESFRFGQAMMASVGPLDDEDTAPTSFFDGRWDARALAKSPSIPAYSTSAASIIS